MPSLPHRDAVIDRDRVELLGDAAGLFQFPGHQLAEILEVHVAGEQIA